MRSVQSNEVRSWYLRRRFQIVRYVPAIVLVDAGFIADPHWSKPPRNIVVPRDRYYRTELPRITKKHRRTLEFASPRPLRKVSGCRHGIERLLGDRAFYGVDLLQHRRPPEVKI